MNFKQFKYIFCLFIIFTSLVFSVQSMPNPNEIYSYMNYNSIFNQEEVLKKTHSSLIKEEFRSDCKTRSNTSEISDNAIKESIHSPLLINNDSLYTTKSLQSDLPNNSYSSCCCFNIVCCKSKKIITSSDLDQELVDLFRKKKTTAMQNALYNPLFGCCISVTFIGSAIPALSYFPLGMGDFGAGIIAFFLFERVSFVLKSLTDSCYRIYAPRTDPLDIYEERYAKKKRFLPKLVQEAIETKFGAYRKSTMGETEILDYTKIALALPARSHSFFPQYIVIQQYLNVYVFAKDEENNSCQNKITTAIINHAANYSTSFGINPKPKNIIFLRGAPGLGKTKMVEEIAKFMGLPLLKVDLGSADPELILGNSSTPGLLLEALIKGPRNAILFFDKMDRVINDPNCTNLLASLLQFFEPNTKYISNSYLGAEIDISHYFIIGSGNSKISDRAFKNRLNIIEIKSINNVDKKYILIKKLGEMLNSKNIEFNLSFSELNQSDQDKLTQIIEDDVKGNDPGFRTTEKKLMEAINLIRLKKVLNIK